MYYTKMARVCSQTAQLRHAAVLYEWEQWMSAVAQQCSARRHNGLTELLWSCASLTME